MNASVLRTLADLELEGVYLRAKFRGTFHGAVPFAFVARPGGSRTAGGWCVHLSDVWTFNGIYMSPGGVVFIAEKALFEP